MRRIYRFSHLISTLAKNEFLLRMPPLKFHFSNQYGVRSARRPRLLFRPPMALGTRNSWTEFGSDRLWSTLNRETKNDIFSRKAPYKSHFLNQFGAETLRRPVLQFRPSMLLGTKNNRAEFGSDRWWSISTKFLEKIRHFEFFSENFSSSKYPSSIRSNLLNTSSTSSKRIQHVGSKS